MKFNKISEKQFNQDCPIEGSYYNIKLPRRATKESAGYDFFLPYNIVIPSGSERIIYTGVNCELDSDKVLMIYPRSGLGFKFKTRLANTVGVIDADYINSDNEGHIMIKLCNEGPNLLELSAGQAFAQGVIMNYYVVSEEDTSELGDRNGGLGSTSNG